MSKHRPPSKTAAPKPRIQATPLQANPPEPRPVFHIERNATPAGDYELRIALSQSTPQRLLAQARRPDGQIIPIFEREIPGTGVSTRIISDAAQIFGVPAGLDAHLFREFLETCRQWVQDDARRSK